MRHLVRTLVAAVVAALAAGLLVGLGSPAQAVDKDCGDFDTQAQAQRFYNDAGPGDPHNLDGSDNDGRVCESLPCPCAGSGGGGGGDTATTLRQHARVVRVVDGDTYVARYGGRRHTVRMIGIDTPEVGRCHYDQATRTLRRALPRGSRVLLVSDRTQDRRDRYGRLLRYTMRTRDHKDINRSQVWKGSARVYVYGGNPFLRTSSYRRAQTAAQNADRGLWGRCGATRG